ncbi:DUF2797 domain-containing protein [Streptomyces sp. RPA4-5]|uniref:DUF2797 domain-containing protein n=1 Tax=Streptomyces sp. RPA4-5 TaxID=2721245 RepID=UPI0032B4E066
MWRCTGPRWSGGGPGPGPVGRFGQRLGWYCAERGEARVSLLPAGKRLAFAARGERLCLGVWRAGRWIVCPYGAVLDGASARDQCARCAQLDRSRSVAADTMADDPRPYGVYLAYFGPGLLKVGITAAERGPARLVEQGAVAYAWLGRGPLMAARRAEALLGSALAVPDRFTKAAKRAARGRCPRYRSGPPSWLNCTTRHGSWRAGRRRWSRWNSPLLTIRTCSASTGFRVRWRSWAG